MRYVRTMWAAGLAGWQVKPHGHRYSVYQGKDRRLVCNDAPIRGYTNIFIQGSTPAELSNMLSPVHPMLVREDPRYGGTTLHIPLEDLPVFLPLLATYFGCSVNRS